MKPLPSMDHLPGFWDDGNWSDVHWAVYRKRRRSRWDRWVNGLDQALHRLMGVFMSTARWERREAKQWPSRTGSYDACEDHYNWLIGRGERAQAAALGAAAQRKRAGFVLN